METNIQELSKQQLKSRETKAKIFRAAKQILKEHDVTIAVAMGEGDGSCTCWGCDLTYEYVKINGDYRT